MQHHDATSSWTSYITGVLAYLASANLETWTALLALLLVIVRLAGDIPSTIQKWRDFNKDDDDDKGSDS